MSKSGKHGYIMAGEHCYLSVYDIPVSGISDRKVVVQLSAKMDYLLRFAELEKQRQDENTIRVYIDEINDMPVFPEILQSHYAWSFGVNPSLYSNGTESRRLMSLWRSGAYQSRWYVVEGIHIRNCGFFYHAAN
ncbi:hypothetical protein N7478_009128 [Penicillium angulare]|uniref:uncharacterized protein n=1 Tax=Penicillium angulare TaxID=116970 RepID=UPI002541D99C|nr:uncharacterized protein N7478_009128 [Penicillium angulare]KAJ5274003.1 hypothetical protein N7478_009128 [Penicillium angulare]